MQPIIQSSRCGPPRRDQSLAEKNLSLRDSARERPIEIDEVLVLVRRRRPDVYGGAVPQYDLATPSGISRRLWFGA